ncbi:hypothetical protein [Peptostreptococcus faecalis]|uniref:hypothetical protein n=1 Tax=Peptostreptococcus faecalis TaxID=2045015 RepID=UPI000C7D688A|nr:hypothetical protein [Peptostreptococcus faecalis]
MKKIFSILTCFVLLMTLSGCNEASDVKVENRTDINFIESVQNGLTARWTILDGEEYKKAEQNDDGAKIAELFAESIRVELSQVKEYSNANFKDDNLKKIANEYIESLELQKKSLAEEDQSKADELYNEGSNKRAKAIIELVDKYKMNIPQNYYDGFKKEVS